MFTLTFQSSKTIEIIFENSPTHSFGNSYFFGFPLHQKIENITGNNIEKELSKVKGYFFYISAGDELILANDILGGYRVYKHETIDKIIYTDNYNTLFEKINNLSINKDEYCYWVAHGYTTGDSTFINGIDKIPPASIIKYSEVENKRLYFKNIINKSNSRLHTESCYNDLLDSINLIKKENKKIILFFSGGKDSVLLASLLKKQNVDFTAVFLKSNPTYKEAFCDLKKSEFIAKQLSINFCILDIDMENYDTMEEFLKQKMLFDRHFSLVHYNGIKATTEKFGKEIIIINGQSSDSILSFGASERTIGYFCRRLLINYNNLLFRFILAFLFSKRFHKNYDWKGKNFNYDVEFYDNHDYIVLCQEKFRKYTRYIYNLIAGIQTKIIDKDSLRMYLKIHSFLQGCDNQVVINTGTYNGMPRIFMPFSTPNFIYNTIRYKSNLKELCSPKYIVKDILKNKCNFKYPKFDSIKVQMEITNAMSINKLVKEKFDILINNVLTSNTLIAKNNLTKDEEKVL